MTLERIRKKYWVVVMLLLSLAAMSLQAADGVVVNQDFSKITDLKAAGWNHFIGKATKFELKDGALNILCGQAPYKGGNINRRIPPVVAGELTFEVALNTNNGKYDHFSLKVQFYNIILAFKKLGTRHQLLRYNSKLKKWKILAENVPLGKKLKFRMLFDNEEKLAQYFINDMESPVMIDENIVLTPWQGKDYALLTIGSYGMSSGEIENKVFNLQLVKLK